jgi:hypothetical protein
MDRVNNQHNLNSKIFNPFLHIYLLNSFLTGILTKKLPLFAWHAFSIIARML